MVCNYCIMLLQSDCVSAVCRDWWCGVLSRGLICGPCLHNTYTTSPSVLQRSSPDPTMVYRHWQLLMLLSPGFSQSVAARARKRLLLCQTRPSTVLVTANLWRRPVGGVISYICKHYVVSVLCIGAASV